MKWDLCSPTERYLGSRGPHIVGGMLHYHMQMFRQRKPRLSWASFASARVQTVAPGTSEVRGQTDDNCEKRHKNDWLVVSMEYLWNIYG